MQSWDFNTSTMNEVYTEDYLPYTLKVHRRTIPALVVLILNCCLDFSLRVARRKTCAAPKPAKEPSRLRATAKLNADT